LGFLKVVFLGAGSFREVCKSMRFLSLSMAGTLLEVWACWRGRRSRRMMMMLTVSKMPEHHHRGPVSLCLLKKLFGRCPIHRILHLLYASFKEATRKSEMGIQQI